MRWKGFIRVSQIIYKSYRKDKCITIISTGYTLIIRGEFCAEGVLIKNSHTYR